MKPALVAALVAIAGLVLFTWLLERGAVGQAVYLGLIGVVALVSVAVFLYPRLQELDIKNLKVTLARLEQVKGEVEAMYGGIENLRRAPMILDGDKMNALGLSGGHLAVGGAVMRYPVGVVKRERERLARIFVTSKSPEMIAKAILDNSLDDKVFKWNGPETPLDAEPKSVEQRQREKGSEKKQ